MERLTCKLCRGDLRHQGDMRFICEYCGAEYLLEGTEGARHFIQLRPAQCSTRKINRVIPTEVAKCFKGSDLIEQVKREMVEKLADAILDSVDYTEELIPELNEVRCTAKVRIIQGKYPDLN